MKKLKLLLLIAGTLSMWQLKAQTGTSCSNSNTITQNYSQSHLTTGSEQWYSFNANSNILQLDIKEKYNIINISKVELYTGNCSSLTLIAKDSLTHSTDSIFSISKTDLIISQNYYFKISYLNTNNNYFYSLLLNPSVVPLCAYCATVVSTGQVFCYGGLGAPVPTVNVCPGEVICFGQGCDDPDITILQTLIFSNGDPNFYLPEGLSLCTPYSVPLTPGIVTVSLYNIITTFTVVAPLLHINVLASTPPPLFSVNPPSPICFGSCVELTSLNDPLTISSYSFNAPGTGLSGFPTPCLQYTATGSYVVDYILNPGTSCSVTTSYNVIVVDPVVNLVSSKDKCSLFQNFIASLNCYPASFPSAIYEWNIYNGSSPASPLLTNTYTPTGSLNYTFPTTGTYYVEIKITVNGNTYSTGQVVIIGGITNLPSFVQGDGSCLNLCFINTTKCDIKNITQWLWTATGPGGFSQTEITKDACFSFPATGIYTICLQQDNNPPGGSDPGLIGVSCKTISVFGPTPIVITNTLLSLCNLPVGGLVTLNPNLSLGATGSVTWVASSGGTLLPIPFTTGINGIITYNLTGFSTYTAPIVFCVTTTNNNCPSTQCVTIYPCCPTVTGTVVYSNTTFTTNTTLSGPTNYHFSGVITLSSGANLSIFNANVTFDPNAKIVVNNNSKLTSSLSYFHACGAMWDGVYLNNGSKLVIDQCTFEDAKRAFIDTLGANSISIENSWFNKNYEGLILKATNTTQKLLVARNVFSCNNIPILYKTVPVVTSAYFSETETSVGALVPALLLPPYSTLKSYSGITLFQTKTPSNPNQYVQIDKYNLFDKLRFGIVATRSRFEVQKNTFQNINPPTLLFPVIINAGIFVYGSSFGSGIFGAALDAKIGGTIPQANNFNNCFYGVFNQYAGDLTIRNNNFNDNRTAILITKNNKNKLVTIDRNKINETRVGVLCYDNIRLNAQITENTLLNTSPVGAYSSNTGIATSEVIFPAGSPTSYAKYNVYNNSITGYYNGVYATNTYSTQITDNEIHLIPSTGVGQSQYGIRVENTNTVKVLNNNIDKASADYLASWQNGIFGHTNTTPYIHCNGIDNMYVSLKFVGSNITTVNGIIGNVMSNAQNGIWLENSGEIGDQFMGFPGGFFFASDNQWTSGFSPLRPQTYSSNSSNLFGITGAKLFTKGPAGGAYYLNNANATGILSFGGNYLIGNYTLFSLGLSCNAGIATPLLMQKAPNIALNTIGFVANASNLYSISKRQLLHNIKLNVINISADAVLQAFVNTSYTNSIGQFYQVDSLINNAINTGSMSLLSNATVLNTAIVNTGNIVYNKKTLNATYMAMLSTEPDSTTLADLRILAQKCPNLEGDAVFQARGILLFYDGLSYESLCDNEPQATPSNGRMANSTELASEIEVIKETRVFPNPTNKDLTIEYVKTDESINAIIEIYNLMGSLVFTKELSDAKTTIDLDVLSSGSYLYQIKYGTATLKQNKLVIVK